MCEIWITWGILLFRQLLLRNLNRKGIWKQVTVLLDVLFIPPLAPIGRPSITEVCLSGLKCAAIVVSASHLYECLAMACGLPRAVKGGGGMPAVGLLAKRGFGGGRRPSTRSSAMN